MEGGGGTGRPTCPTCPTCPTRLTCPTEPPGPPGGRIFAAALRDTLYIRDVEEVAVSEILYLSQDDQHNDRGCFRTVVLTHPLHHIL